MKKFVVLLIGLMTAVGSFAKDYYCAPNGTGDGSSYEKAGSFTSLVQAIGAGDVLYCLGGQYDLTYTVNISKQGTKENLCASSMRQARNPSSTSASKPMAAEVLR